MILWNIDISKHCVFNLADNEPRQQHEAYHGYEVEPSLEQGESVENTYLIDHVVMAQGEQPRERLQCTIHAHYRES